MKKMMLLASYGFAISQFAYTAFAAPVESDPSLDTAVNAPLIARQAGTYSGDDPSGNGGVYYCYKGGTWALQTSLNSSLYLVCGAAAYDAQQFQGFSFKPNADGTWSNQASDYQQTQNCFTTSKNCDASAQKGQDYLHYTAVIATPQHNNTADCEYAMETVRDMCHGEHGYTRGGYYTYTDGTTYGCDVSHNGSNQ